MLGPSVGYVDILDESTVEKIAREAKEKKFPLRPSSAGSCARQLAFQLMEYYGKDAYQQESFGPSVYRLLSLGSYVEAHLIKQFEASGFKTLYKQQVLSFGKMVSKHDSSLSHEIEGSIDFLLVHEGHKCVADVKSKKDWSTGRFVTNWSDTSKKLKGMQTVVPLSKQAFWVEDLEGFLGELQDPFFESNFMQLNFYAMSDFLQARTIDHAAIFQYNKNTSELREVRFAPSQKLFERVLNKFQVVMDAVALEGPASVPRDYEKNSIVCRYCKYMNVCNKISSVTAEDQPKEGI